LETPFRDRRDVLLGDNAFDETVTVQGPEALALALLDSDTRRGVASLIAGRLDLPGHPPLWVSGRVSWGVLRLDLADAVLQLRRVGSTEELPQAGDVYLDGEYQLPAVLLAAVDLGTRLLAPNDLPGRLAANLQSEREAGVRRRLLGMLLREFPESQATRAAVRTACHDPDAEVRLRAAIALGKEGRPVLLGVAGGEGAADETAASAVAALRHALTLVEAKDLLRNALRTRRLLAARSCLDVIGRIGGGAAEAIPVLSRVLLVEANELGEAAAAALAATHDPAAEAPLLRALADGPAGRRRAAATALGRVGTRDAVQPLREAERDSELRAAARQAIAEIHARLAGAEQGQLSLADGEPGRLSLADGEAGRLSLSDEKPDSRVT
jgi:hypothetical protein